MTSKNITLEECIDFLIDILSDADKDYYTTYQIHLITKIFYKGFDEGVKSVTHKEKENGK